MQLLVNACEGLRISWCDAAAAAAAAATQTSTLAAQLFFRARFKRLLPLLLLQPAAAIAFASCNRRTEFSRAPVAAAALAEAAKGAHHQMSRSNAILQASVYSLE